MQSCKRLLHKASEVEKMRTIIKIVLCLALLALIAGCQKEVKDSTATIISSEIIGISDLDRSLDTSELDALESDIAKALEGLES